MRRVRLPPTHGPLEWTKRGGSNGLRAHFTRATCPRSPPYRPAGCHIWSRRAAVANRARPFQRRIARPSRRGQARPGAGIPCTKLSTGRGRRQRCRASSVGRAQTSRGYTNAEVVRHGCCAARPRGSVLLVSFRQWGAAADCDLLEECAIRRSVLLGCEIFCRNEQVGCGVFQRIRPLHGPEAVHPIRPHPRSGGPGQRLRHPASSAGLVAISLVSRERKPPARQSSPCGEGDPRSWRLHRKSRDSRSLTVPRPEGTHGDQ